MAVWLEHRQSQPVDGEQEEPSQLPMQSDHEQDGSHGSVGVVKRAAARGRADAKDFMTGGSLRCVVYVSSLKKGDDNWNPISCSRGIGVLGRAAGEELRSVGGQDRGRYRNLDLLRARSGGTCVC